MKSYTCLLALLALTFHVASAQDLREGADDEPLLTVEETRQLVLEQNPEVVISRLQSRIAENDASLSNAGYLPRLGLTAAQREAAGGGLDGGTLDASADLSLTLFDGLTRPARYRRLNRLAEAQRLRAEARTEAVLAEALATYFEIAGLQQQLNVLREAVALSEERLQIAEGRRDAGAASDLEVRRALVDLNADRSALLRQQAVIAQAEAFLNRLLNRPDGEDFRVESEVTIDESLDLGQLISAARQEAPALRAAEVDVEAARLEATGIRREFWPAIDLSAGYNLSGLTDPVLPPTQREGFFYGLTARFDLFAGGNRLRRLENARTRIEQSAWAAEEATVARLTALRSTYALYERSLTLVELEEENVEAARMNAEVALERFRLGVSTSLELREVQRALIDAESSLVRARFEAKSAEVDLRSLAGVLLQ